MSFSIISSKKKSYLITFLIGIFILFSSPADSDFGWHLRYGQLINQEHSLPHSNKFSFTFDDYEWADSYWLSQSIIYKIYELIGVTGLSLTLSICTITGLLIYLRYFDNKESYIKNLTIPLLLTFLCLEYSRISIRPLFFSSMALITLLTILNKKTELIPYLPIMFLLWANLHADFTIGLLIFVFYILSGFIRARNIKLETVLSFVLSVAATVVNPYGLLLHKTLLKESQPFQFLYIQEWRPLWEVDIKLAVYVLLVAVFIVLQWEKLSEFVKILFIMFFLASFRYSYFSRIFVLIMLPSLVMSFDYLYSRLYKSTNLLRKKTLGIALRIAIFTLMLLYSISFFKKVDEANSTRKWSINYGFPYDATQYIKQNNLEGNLYNSYSWGGYLIWQLPENKVFIDGRMPSWRIGQRSVFEDYISIQRDPEANIALLKSYIDIYDIKLALLQRDSLTIKVLKDLGWEILYVDDISVVLKSPEIYYQMAQKIK